MADQFRDAELWYRSLRAERDAGKLSDQDFIAACDQLRVQTSDGYVWQIASDSGDWYKFENGQWILGDPRGDVYDNLALRLRHLQNLRDTGQITPQTYAESVEAIRVTEPDGTEWALHPETGAWIRWDGQQWVEGQPPKHRADGRPATEVTPFSEFETSLFIARDRLERGVIDEAQFCEQVMKCRLMDERGHWWQLNPETGRWLRWDGQSWQEAEPQRETASIAGGGMRFASHVGQSFTDELKATMKAIPAMIKRTLITRVILAVISFIAAVYANAYIAGYKNEGWNYSSTAWAPWLYLQGSPHGMSYAVIWGFAGVLLSSLLFTLFRKGGTKRLGAAVKAPFAVFSSLKSYGKDGFGAIAMGAGVAILLSTLFGFNRQAGLTLGIGMLFVGAGFPGRILARFVMGFVRRVLAPAVQGIQKAAPFDLRLAQLAIIGVAPGFFLAPRLPGLFVWPAIVGLVVAGVLIVRSSKRVSTAMPVLCLLLLCALCASYLALLWNWLFPETALADDGGKSEFTGNPEDYWEVEGPKLREHSRPAGISAATGAALGSDLSDDSGELSDGDFTFTMSLDEYALSFEGSGQAEVRAWVTVNGSDLDQCYELEQSINASIQMAAMGNVTEWFTVDTVADASGAVCAFQVEVPTDPEQLRGPNIAYIVAEAETPLGMVTQRCRINIDVQADYALVLNPLELRVKANESVSSISAEIECRDPSLAPEERIQKAKLCAPSIQFVLAGDQARWVGGPGQVEAALTETGKDITVSPAVPASDLQAAPPFFAEVEVSCELEDIGVLTAGGRIQIDPPDWLLDIEPSKSTLAADGQDAVQVRLRVSPADGSKLDLYMSEGGNALNSLLVVRAEGPCAQHVTLRNIGSEGDWHVYEATVGDGASSVAEPYFEIVAEATLTGSTVSQTTRIEVESKARLEVLERSIALRPGGQPAKVHAEIKNAGSLDWDIQVEVVGSSELSSEGPAEKTGPSSFILSFTCGSFSLATPGVRLGTLRLTGYATTSDGGEVRTETVEVAAKLVQPGLHVTPPVVDLPFDPAVEPPAQFRIQVLTLDEESGGIRSSIEQVSDIEIGPWEDSTIAGGANVFTGAKVFLDYQYVEGFGADMYAVWHAKQEVVIPSYQPIDAMVRLSVPGDWGDITDRFTTRHRFMAPADPAAMAAHLIRVEQANCRKILKYLPEGELRDRFSDTIENHAQDLGAEGLYHLRHEIWNAARAALMEEAQSYLESAQFYGAAATTLDWVNYLCGLILQGMSSVLVPFPGDMAVVMLYQAVPDMVTKVYGGMPATKWAEEWVAGFKAALPGMAADMALGQAFGLEKLIIKGIEEFKDVRKALAVACIIYWQVRFVRYQTIPKPNGEPYSLKESVVFGLRDLAEEIITTGISKNTKFVNDGLEAPGATGWLRDYDPNNRHGYDTKDGRSYYPSKKRPDTEGMPDANLQAAIEIARRHGVELYIRPTNPAARQHLLNGAHPKPESLKAKSITPLDVALNPKLKPEDVGKIGYFDPGPNPPPKGNMPDADYAKLLDRYKQRKQEFADNAAGMEKLKKDGIDVDDNGVIKHPDGKPYTGDHDIFDVRGPNGERVSPEKYREVMDDLSKPPFRVQHPGHRQWDYSGASKEKPPSYIDANGKKVEPQSKFEQNQAIDNKILDSHQSRTSSGAEGEGLIKIDANGNVSNSHANPSSFSEAYDARTRSSQAGMQTIRHDMPGEEDDEP